jgi:quercetin dioxygenase-like cupin family protein
MNLKNLHTENKAVQTNVVFTTQDAKVISLQIAGKERLKEHLTKVPAFLVCVSGEAVYEDEKGFSIEMKSGDYVAIEPNLKHWIDAKVVSNFILVK